MSGFGLKPGQVTVITGGAAGIGLALGRACLARGLKVVLADRDTKALERVSSELGEQVCTVPTDVTKPGDIVRLRDRALEVFGRVDLLFNNAGIYPGMAPVWTIDPEAWRQLYEVNFWSVVHGIQAFVPLFIEQGAGRVINTASMSGLSTVPGSADYGSAKHAVIAVSETLHADLAMAGHDGVGVTVLCPSLVMTDMGRAALGIFDAAGDGEARKSVGSGPNLSAVLSPEQLAEAALDGIEAGHRYVLPTPQSRARFEGRVKPIFDAFDLYPVAGPKQMETT